ncbi:MAG: GTP cyclohydrolase I FolE [Cytophagales bacterium]|nr:MAG: GTP cyclohydrolase I FolE [Cytophagales bacterium]TAF61223.1 MAG: GTP cyclohydrolase I FolE [Cytophagales bacterium]
MKQNETSLNFLPNGNGNGKATLTLNGKHKHSEDCEHHHEHGDLHIATSLETPMRPDAFAIDDDTKVKLISEHFREIMNILGLDLTDDSLNGTPHRVAKMYVKEIFSGLNPQNKPEAKMFDNKFGYGEMLIEKNVSFFSCCEHHFVPIFGHAHVAYMSSGKVIGLSKINRIVKYFARRPQVQERLTNQIGHELQRVLQTEDVAIIMDAAHMCVMSRGVEDTQSSTITSFFGGKFKQESTKKEFLSSLSLGK